MSSRQSQLQPQPEKYIPPKKMALPTDYDDFMKSLTEPEKELLRIAEEKLGSSFFVQWTHLYKKWKSSSSSSSSSTK